MTVLQRVRGAQGSAAGGVPRRVELAVRRARQVPARQVNVRGARANGGGVLREHGAARRHGERRGGVSGHAMVCRVRRDGAPYLGVDSEPARLGSAR